MPPFLEALSHHILIVENDRDLHEMLKAALESDGFHVTFAARKGTAIELLSSLMTDLVVADMGLPDGLGMDVARQAAALGIPSILMTGHPRYMADLDVKGVSYVAKPFLPERLRQEVRDRLVQNDRLASPSPR